MPSIHAAFPVLVWLVAWRLWPRWGWAAVLYPAGVAFAVVYLGEHHVIDVLAGWLYAAVAFLAIWSDYGWLRRRALTPNPLPREVRPVPSPSEEGETRGEAA